MKSKDMNDVLNALCLHHQNNMTIVNVYPCCMQSTHIEVIAKQKNIIWMFHVLALIEVSSLEPMSTNTQYLIDALRRKKRTGYLQRCELSW
jgi:hypothetical protein